MTMEMYPTTIEAATAFTIDDEDDFALPLVDDETTGAFQLQQTISSTSEVLQLHPDETANPEGQSATSQIRHLMSSTTIPPPTTTTSSTSATSMAPITSVSQPATQENGAVPPQSMIMPTNDRYHPDMLDLKLKRKRRTAALGIVGGVAGALLLGPIGAIAIGSSAAICTTAASKRKERRKMKEIKRKRQELDRAMEQAELEAQAEFDANDVSSDLTDDTASTEESLILH